MPQATPSHRRLHDIGNTSIADTSSSQPSTPSHPLMIFTSKPDVPMEMPAAWKGTPGIVRPSSQTDGTT